MRADMRTAGHSDARDAAFKRCRQWVESCGRDEMATAVASGFLDSEAFVSGSEGFTWACALPERLEALAWALDAGWRADKPCVRSRSGRGGASAWLPFEAVAYEMTLCKFVEPASAGACVALMLAGGVRMAEVNPRGETAMHDAAKLPGVDKSARSEACNPVLRAILDVDPRLECVDAGGKTALHVARGEHNILALLDAGADHEARDARGARALDAILAAPGGPAAWARFEGGLLRRDVPESCAPLGLGARRL